jgi:uncharacterized protein (DUF433 family)
MAYNGNVVTSDGLGIGLYSMVEAARLLRTPRRTLSRWVEGYVREVRFGLKSYAPVVPRGDEPYLSFGDLVELLYVRGFRDAGVQLDELRETAAKFRDEWSVPYPFATKRFATDGKHLLIKLGGDWQHALTGQRQAFFDELGRQLVHMGDLAAEWRPLGADRAVVLHPDRAFGKPIEDTSGAHTYVLAQALQAEGDVAAVAWWYGTTSNGVEDAAEFERRFAGCIVHGDIFLR